jgi:hypothetical protein
MRLRCASPILPLWRRIAHFAQAGPHDTCPAIRVLLCTAPVVATIRCGLSIRPHLHWASLCAPRGFAATKNISLRVLYIALRGLQRFAQYYVDRSTPVRAPESMQDDAECASRTRRIVNLCMRSANECGVRLNLRRMDRLVSMTTLVIKRPRWLKTGWNMRENAMIVSIHPKVCDHCGGRFGMVTHHWWGNKFCKRTCKDAHLRALAIDRDKILGWYGFLRGVSRRSAVSAG